MQQPHQLDLDTLRAYRHQIRQSIEASIMQANDIWTNRDTHVPQEAETRILLDKLTRYEDLHDQLSRDIEALLTDADQRRTDFAASMSIRDNLWETHTKLNMLLESSATQHNRATAMLSLPPSPTSKSCSHSGHKHVRLPQLKIPKFSGDPLSWQEFIDSFESSIGSDDDLKPVDKLNYLKNHLEGEALQTIKGFRATNDNYEKAMDTLKVRFGNSQLAIFAHMDEFVRIPPAQDNTASLRSVFDSCIQQIRSLEALGCDEEKFGLVFTPVILNKLPQSVLFELSRRKDANGPTLWDLPLVRKLLGDEIQSRSFAEWSVSSRFKPKPGNNSQAPPNHFPNVRQKPHPPTTSVLANAKARSLKCCFCSHDHFADECNKLTTAAARRSFLLEHKLCTRCLRPDHSPKQCLNARNCFHCGKDSHHRSLCFTKFGGKPQINGATKHHVQLNPSAPVFQPHDATVSQNASNSNEAVHMQMAVVPFGQGIAGRIWFDTLSSLSYITTELANALQLRPFDKKITWSARFEDHRRRQRVYDQVKVPIRCFVGSIVEITTLVTDHISCPIYKQAIDVAQFPLLSQIPLADPTLSRSEAASVDIVVGMNHYFDFVQPVQIRVGNGLVFTGSKLGYLAGGRSEASSDPNEGTFLATTLLAFDDISNPQLDLERFWSLEDIGITDDPASTDDDIALQRLGDTVCIKNGRYEIGWPWKPGHPELPDNYRVSFARLKQTVKSIQSQPEVLKAYDTVIQSQVENGIVEQVDTSKPCSNLIHYLPHRHVVKLDRPTTKLRVVYDASARSTRDSPSLNDCLFRGPIFLGDLAGLLIRFRTKPVAVTSDIEKAFLQISLRESDRDVTRFLWLKDLSRPVTPSNIVVYRFSRIFFGAICCPSILGFVMNHKLASEASKWAQQMLRDHFVDNLASGTENTTDAVEFYRECKRLLSEISMNLCQWHSNDSQFLESISAEDRGKSAPAKVLGMYWDTESDLLYCNDPGTAHFQVRTKRDLVSAASRIFDPMGLLSPVVISAKLLVQETWKRKIRWEDMLPDDMLQAWAACSEDFSQISLLRVPRFILYTAPESPLQLHCFCDASGKAYAAAVYLRHQHGDKFKSHLLYSKSKLAPTKPLSLPRLELMAVVLGTRILKFVSLHLNLNISETFVWTDSKCTLYWIESAKVLTVFVANRVREIKAHQNTQFRYVPTIQNPADLPTRGCSAVTLLTSSLWWYGPDFLAEQSKRWPRPELAINRCDESGECVAQPSLAVTQAKATSLVLGPADIDASRFSSLSKLVRVTALVLRFIALCRKNPISSTQTKTVSAVEYRRALLLWVFHTQKSLVPPKDTKQFDLFKNKLRQLGAKADSAGIIRCYGRLGHSDLQGDAKAPALLPKDHHFTRHVIVDVHSRLLHSGPAQTLAEVRQQFWICSGLRVVKQILHRCNQCRQWEGGSYQTPPFPPLPSFRSTLATPFTCTGVDYMGPLLVSTSSGSSKVWICLFTCATSRAVHLEVVLDLSTEQFLLCLRRFISLYGTPEVLVSDNGSQFKSACNVLTRLWSEITGDIGTHQFLAEKGISWKFIPEHAPWMGGFYERLIGSAKRSLKKVLGRVSVTLAQLQTIAAEVASTLNRRPLVMTDDVNDPILTPAHLLGKFRLCQLPELECSPDYPNFVPRPSKTEDLVNLWKSTTALVNQFKDVWSKSYLNSLRETQYKGKGRARALEAPQVGDVVLIRDKNVSRCRWKVGKITELQPSFDNEIRSAKVLLPSHKTIIRPITILFPIETSTKITSDDVGRERSEHLDGTQLSQQRNQASAGESPAANDESGSEYDYEF